MRRLAIVLALLLVAAPIAAPITAKPLRVGGAVKRPELIKKVEPQIPKEARGGGTIILATIIGKDGKFRKIRIIRDSYGYPLGPLYVKAMKQWEWKPATLRGKPVEVEYYLTVNIDVQ